MIISFDPAKREKNLGRHGLDLADAVQVLAGVCIDRYDDRYDYGEDRWISYGLLGGQAVVCVWADEGETIRVISLRKATANERQSYFPEVGG